MNNIIAKFRLNKPNISAKFMLCPKKFKTQFSIKVLPSKVSQLENDEKYIKDDYFIEEQKKYALKTEVDTFKYSEELEMNEIVDLLTSRTDNMINLLED